jgi:hypothetical protein
VFSSSECVHIGSGALPSLPVQHILVAIFMVVKYLGHEGDHSSPSSAKVKNVTNYTSTPPYIFTTRCLLKNRGHLVFT